MTDEEGPASLRGSSAGNSASPRTADSAIVESNRVALPKVLQIVIDHLLPFLLLSVINFLISFLYIGIDNSR